MRKTKILLFLLSQIPFWCFGQLPVSKNNFVVIAHRGNHTNAPENTLLAIQHAIDVGADYVEIDLRTSIDGELIIMHDRTVDRTTDKSGNANAYTLKELKTLKVQDKKHPEWGTHRIPTFMEVLRLCKDNINIYLDFKDASVKKTFKEIVAMKMEKQVVVYINEAQQFKDWREIAPKMPLMLSLEPEVKTAAQLVAFLNTYQPDVLDGGYDNYTAELVKVAQDRNVPVWPDIQSESESLNWEKAIATGLSGLQTDHPKDLIAFLKARNIR